LLDPGVVNAALQALWVAANQPDKKDRRPVLTALSGIPVDKAIPAPPVLPQAHLPGLFFTSVPTRTLASQGHQLRPLIVVPAANPARTTCHPLLDSVTIA
jgi:hypothetical protein